MELTNHYNPFPSGNDGDDTAIITWDGYRRLSMMEELILDTLTNNIEGDIAEAGVWKGAMPIFFAKIIDHSKSKKKIINFDSFCGCPTLDNGNNETLYLGNSNDIKIKTFDKKWGGALSYSLDDVKNNFKKFNLLKDNIVFIKGYFCNTLPYLESNLRLSILRIDCDLYQSTYEVLEYLYPKLNKGGYVIFDDYKFPESKQAIIDYRDKNNINTSCCFGKTFDNILFWKKE